MLDDHQRPPSSFETPRLRLRPPLLEDADSIFERYGQDPEVTRHLVWKPHNTVEVTRAFLHRCVQCWVDGTAFPWVIETKNTSDLLGMIELRVDGHMADLGYVLARPEWSKGYATEAARAVVGWAISQDSIYRVWAVVGTENPASVRVLEKVGMQREGVLRRWIAYPNQGPEPRDSFCYSVVR